MRSPTGTSTSISTPTAGCTAIDARPTRIAALHTEGGHRTVLTSGRLRPQVVHSRQGWCRIGLLATTALLLGGDVVELEVEVGPGARLDLFDVAGTVAFHGRGLPASWSVRIRVAAGGKVRLAGLPFVVADGARVTRRLELELVDDAQAAVRDTLVLGRAGEQGGWLRSVTSVRRDSALVLLEDLTLDPAWRRRPGMLGDARVLDTVALLGVPSLTTCPPGTTRFRLPGEIGELRRYCGQEVAESPLHEQWDSLVSEAYPPRSVA